MNFEMLATVEREKNNWQGSVSGALAAGVTGARLGTPICGPVCGYIDAKAAITLLRVLLEGFNRGGANE